MTPEQLREALEACGVKPLHSSFAVGGVIYALDQKSLEALAARLSPPTAGGEDMVEVVAENVARHIAKEEAHSRCKTLDESLLHQANWKRLLPEAREIVSVALTALNIPALLEGAKREGFKEGELAERERCAKVAEGFDDGACDSPYGLAARVIAQAIRTGDGQ